MTVAELFIKLGVKGTDSAGKALKGVKGGLDSIAAASLEAKAALVAVVYGMEQIMTQSAKRGMDLQKFADLTGLSTDRLQRWEYAARQSGVTAEDMEGSIKGVQTAMTDMLTGKGAPAGMGIFAKAVGFDPAKARDTFYVMDKLREFAKAAPPDIGNSVLRSFGLSDDTIQFMRKSKIELDKIKPTNVYSSSEIERLAKIHVAWENLWNTLKYFMGHTTAKFGMPIVEELSKALSLVMDLAYGIEKLTGKFPALADAGKVAILALGIALAAFGGPLTAISVAITGIIFLLGEWKKFKLGEDSVFSPQKTNKSGTANEDTTGTNILEKGGDLIKNTLGDIWGRAKEVTGIESPQPEPSKERMFPSPAVAGQKPYKPSAVPESKKGKTPAKVPASKKEINYPGYSPMPTAAKNVVAPAATQNINIKQDLNFQHEGKNAKQTGDSVKKSIQDAVRQMSVQGQGT